MVRPKTLTMILAAIATIAGLGGCSSKAAVPEKGTPERASPEKAAPGSTAPARAPERAAKPAARESAFATYSNPEYAVAFRYPRNFALQEVGDAEEGTPEDASGVRSQQELESEEPGAVLIATITVPNDAFPNTTFAGGSLQFAVNRYSTAGTCRSNLVARLGDSYGTSGTAVVQGVTFAWTNNDSGDASTEFFERDYAGFADETCYEFFLRVGVGGAPDADAGARPLDEKRVLGNLDKIVASLQFDTKAISVLDGNASSRGNRGKF
jgi:hypothetical protein